MKKRFYLSPLVLALLAAIVSALYLMHRVTKAEQQLAVLTAQEPSASPELTAHRRLAAADAYLYAGRYDDASAAYKRLQQDSSFVGMASPLADRLNHAQTLRRMSIALDTLSTLSGRRPLSAAPLPMPASVRPKGVAPLAIANSRPEDFDSLSFALQKAELRIRNLEQRLQRSTAGNYLTFTSGQGNEVYYVGDVTAGKANGSGVALLSSGSRYAGDWRDNRRHGEGTFRWSDGAYYEGSFYNDQRDGQGTYHFPSGEVYVGEWENDLRNGEGVVYDRDGEVVAQGLWEDDELVAKR